MDAWAVVEHGKPLQKISKPIPEPTGTEVLIRVTHCGVCHSDLHFWEGKYDLGGGKVMRIADRGGKLPRAIGHEILGDVRKLGPDAEAIPLGARRIVYPWVGCGNCRRCDEGEDNMCVAHRSLGVLADGGFGQYVIVPHAKYLADPGDLDPAIACTFGCSGITVLSACRKVLPMEPHDPILLLGAGGLGLSAIAMLRALGHKNIISVDINATKRVAAAQAGATATVDGTAADAQQQVLDAAGGSLLGTIDFVNNSQTAAMAYAVLGKGGRMVQVGVMGGELPVSLVGLIFKGATIMGNLTGNPAHLQEVTALTRGGKLMPIPTTMTPWDNANSALMDLRDGKVTGRLILTQF